MTFFDIVLFSGMIIGFVVGIHQSLYYGVANSYWLFMLSTISFLWLNHRLRKKKNLEIPQSKAASIHDKNPKKTKMKK
jgi:hypothetical protein